jgi:hypothetical protein
MTDHSPSVSSTTALRLAERPEPRRPHRTPNFLLPHVECFHPVMEEPPLPEHQVRTLHDELLRPA